MTSTITMAKVLVCVFFGLLALSPALLQEQDPCQTNVIFPGTILRSFDNVKNFSDVENAYCDISLREGWYRVMVNNEDVDLARVAPPPGSCNTYYPIWMNGSLPTILSQEIAAKACMVSSKNRDCDGNLDIKVMNCGQYNVYYLRRFGTCPAAYCLDVRAPCPEGTSSETGTYPGCSDKFPDVRVTPAVVPLLGNSTENRDFEDLRFECRFPFPDPSYFYDIVWRINGNEVTRMVQLSAANLPLDAQLLETEWKHRYKLGINVRCSVRVRASQNGIPSPQNHSVEFFAGLKTLNTSVDVTEGESVMIQYQATVPVPCNKGVPCKVVFNNYAIESTNGQCQRTIPGNCGFVVDSANWNVVGELKVTGDYDNKYGDRLAEIFLQSASPVPYGPDNVWSGVSPQVVYVNIHDSDAQHANAYCQINDDPHFLSFDGRRFDVHLSGEFVLYRHKTLPQEVRGFFQACGNNDKPPHCVCGAAVRSGEQIFVWSRCKDNRAYQTTLSRVYGCSQRQMRVTTNRIGQSYQVDLPNGLKVTMESHSIKITPSAADFNQTTGLCGNFNGNEDDEFIDPDGVQHSSQCDFYLLNRKQFCVVNKYGVSWKIVDSRESYYGYPEHDLPPAPIGRCSCSPHSGIANSNVTCTNAPPQECGTLDPDVTEEYCTQIPGSSARRRKRQAEEDNDGLNDDDVRPVFPSYNVTDFEPPEWTNGWNEQKARDHCLQFYRRSPAFDPCSKVINVELEQHIDFCVIDILLSGDTTWTLASLETFKSNCMSAVRRNTTLWVAENNETPLLELVTEASCPAECSFHGSCVKGVCQCEAGWIGDDCSIDISQPPEVLGLPKRGLCNIRNRKCNRTLVYGKRFARSDTLICKFEQIYVNNGTTVRNDTTTVFTTQAYYRHSDEIVCSLPSNATMGINEKGLPVGYYLSVSNYNDVYSQTLLFLPYHSEDFSCSIIGMEARCEKIEVNSGSSTTGTVTTGDKKEVNSGSSTTGTVTTGDKKEDEKGPKSGSPCDRAASSVMVIMILGMKWAVIG